MNSIRAIDSGAWFFYLVSVLFVVRIFRSSLFMVETFLHQAYSLMTEV